jgi:hypothetical protein
VVDGKRSARGQTQPISTYSDKQLKLHDTHTSDTCDLQSINIVSFDKSKYYARASTKDNQIYFLELASNIAS